MPIYRKVSLEELKLWLIELKSIMKKIKSKPSKSAVLYFIVSLYEYVQIYSKLSILNSSYEENIKITIKDIKEYLNDDSLLATVNKFKLLRDNVSHGFVNEAVFMILLFSLFIMMGLKIY